MTRSIRIIILLVVLFLVGVGGVMVYSKIRASKSNGAIPNVGAHISPKENPLNTALQKAAAADSDLDGLSNDEEKKFGTDPNLIDTDGDGLSDYAEVNLYHTNPTNKDSQGTGHTDGWAVEHGRIIQK